MADKRYGDTIVLDLVALCLFLGMVFWTIHSTVESYRRDRAKLEKRIEALEASK